MKFKLNLHFSRLYLFILSLHIVYKSYSNSLTTDEAYTFLEYVYTGNIFNIGIANNHLLNTFLMYFSTRTSISEIFLRLPNLLSGLFYFVVLLKISKKSKYPFFTVALLTSPIYLIEYFTLARGYGLGSFFIFFGCVNYYIFNEYKFNFLISSFSFVLAALSIHIYVIFLILFIFINLPKETKKSRLITLIAFITSSFFSYFIVNWVFAISESGKPLFGSESIDILTILKTFFGLIDLFVIRHSIFYVIFLFIFILPYLVFGKLLTETLKFGVIANLTLLSFFILPIIFNKPFPVQRVLIPILPVFLLLFLLVVEEIDIGYNNFESKLVILYSIFFIINLFTNIDNNSTIDWGPELPKEVLICDQTALEDMRVRMAEYYRLLYKSNISKIC